MTSASITVQHELPLYYLRVAAFINVNHTNETEYKVCYATTSFTWLGWALHSLLDSKGQTAIQAIDFCISGRYWVGFGVCCNPALAQLKGLLIIQTWLYVFHGGHGKLQPTSRIASLRLEHCPNGLMEGRQHRAELCTACLSREGNLLTSLQQQVRVPSQKMSLNSV